MSHLIISYPTISESDFHFIQTIRGDHDPRYFKVVKPHFTFVFGTKKLTIDELKIHAMNATWGLTKIVFTLDTAIVIEDDSKEFFHTFLVPTQGYEQIVKMHDQLYTGMLVTELRKKIPYIPHIGIGTSESEEEMNQLAETLNKDGVHIEGSIDNLSLVSLDDGPVVDVDSVELMWLI